MRQVYENDSFVLYRLDDPAPPNRPVLLFDTSWKGFLDTVFNRLDLSRCYDFRYISDFAGAEGGEPVELITDNAREAALDIWSVDNPGNFFVPTPTGSAFNSDVSPRPTTCRRCSGCTCSSPTQVQSREMVAPGIFGTLKGSFTGLPRAAQVKIPEKIPETGRYRVLVRAAATANKLSGELASPSDWTTQ